MMYTDGDGHGGAWLVGMIVMMLLFWGGLFAVVWVSFRWMTSHGRVGPAADAQQILAQRLARGEIDPEEYQRRMSALNGS